MIRDLIETLEWMIKQLDWQNKQNLQVQDSPEMLKAKNLLEQLKKLE